MTTACDCDDIDGFRYHQYYHAFTDLMILHMLAMFMITRLGRITSTPTRCCCWPYSYSSYHYPQRLRLQLAKTATATGTTITTTLSTQYLRAFAGSGGRHSSFGGTKGTPVLGSAGYRISGTCPVENSRACSTVCGQSFAALWHMAVVRGLRNRIPGSPV